MNIQSRTIVVQPIHVNRKNTPGRFQSAGCNSDSPNCRTTTGGFTKKSSRRYNHRVWTTFKYWLPRLLILGFAFSMVMPAPEFIGSMEEAEFLVWLLRVIWVLAFPAGFFVLLIVTDLMKKSGR